MGPEAQTWIMLLNALNALILARARRHAGKSAAFPQRSTKPLARGRALRPVGSRDTLNASRSSPGLIHSDRVADLGVQKLNDLLPIRALAEVLENEDLALFDAHFGSPSRGKLERGHRAPRPRDAPGGEPMSDADDRAVPGKEDDVDGETHEEHVHGARVFDQHPLARLEPVATEQTAHPAERALRNLAALADNCPLSGEDARERHPGHRVSMAGRPESVRPLCHVAGV